MLEHTSMDEFMHGLYTAKKDLGVGSAERKKSVF